MGDDAPGAPAGVPPFTAERLLLIGTGALGVAFLPFWLNWLRGAYPRLQTRVVLTRSAERFVTREALSAIGDHPAVLDVWPQETGATARHVDLAAWPDAVAVFPASLHYIARFALGLAESPSLLALQCTAATVGIAPSLPPFALERSQALAEHLDTLRGRGVAIAAPHAGRSASTGRPDAAVSAPLPVLLELLEARRAAAP